MKCIELPHTVSYEKLFEHLCHILDIHVKFHEAICFLSLRERQKCMNTSRMNEGGRVEQMCLTSHILSVLALYDSITSLHTSWTTSAY